MPDTEFTRFAAALHDPAMPCPPGLWTGAHDRVDAGFAVYRSNVHHGLVDVLAEHFPITRTLVGEEFFHGMAAAFVRKQLPRCAELQHYGAHFPPFIASFPPATHLPFLADMARVESAWLSAWGAADHPALSLGDLRTRQPAQLAASRVAAHPATSLVVSAYPVGTLWQRHQQAAPDLSDLAWEPEALLITRPALEVRMTRLSEHAARFTARLLGGDSIALAAQCELGNAQHEAAGVLATLLEAGAFEEIA